MTDQQKVQLLPCPWCGSHKVGARGRCIECTSCGASGPELLLGGTQSDMDALWNARQAALAHASSETTNPQESSSRLVDARDAARYQFLRDESSADRGEPFIAINVGSISRWTGAYADEKIDQAIAGRRGDGNG